MRHIFIVQIGLAAVLFFMPLCAESRGIDDLPARARLAILKAAPLMQDGDYAAAAKKLKAYQDKRAPDDEVDAGGYHHPEVYFTLGNCYLMMARFEQAITAYQNAVRRDPRYSAAWQNLARAYYETGQLTEAGRCFDTAYDTADEKKPDLLYFSALSALMAGDNEQSIARFKRLMAAHPSAMKPQWKESLVHALIGANRSEAALPHIRDLVNTYTGEKQIQWQEILLDQYLQLDMTKEALDLAQMFTQNAPEIDKWWRALAYIYLNNGQYEAALGALIPYSFLTSLTREEKKLFADLCLEVDIPVKAAPVYEECLQKQPDKKMLRRLVLAYQQLGKPETALERIAAFSEDANDLDMIRLMAELHYTLKHYDKAAALYRRAAEIPGGHRGRSWLMAGYASWQADQLTAARNAFLQAKRYNQQREAARKALRAIASVE
ncbi:MAG: tetratricopeptide repeat protein [Thermodesulfobacteriota bacterium]|nr:tetratricopeptide repeat protein [Thermodesulfobacteriota bacterium]